MLHEELKANYLHSSGIRSLLKGSGISLLDDFLDNWEMVKSFNEKYYSVPYPKIVLCGINPGKNGAGKTGIPFLDFLSLSKLLDGVSSKSEERSAQFFYEIVNEIGAEEFYRTFYVTNISWIGYSEVDKCTNRVKNKNYYDLPNPAKKFVIEMFKKEMQAINPTTIISMSQEVNETIKELYGNSSVEISQTLNHPFFCSIESNKVEQKKKYMKLLSTYIKARKE